MSRSKRFLGTIANLASDRQGATAVEFAIVAVPLLSLIMLALQTATIFFYNEALQTVAIQSARQIMTGVAQKGGTTASQFHTAVCANAPSVFQCSAIMVDVQSYSSFSTVNTSPITVTYNGSGAPTNTWSFSPGGPGDIVIMRVMYDWPVLSGPFGLGLVNQSNNTHLMIATTVFKVEPYQ